MFKQQYMAIAAVAILGVALTSCSGETAASSGTLEEDAVPSMVAAEVSSPAGPDLIPVDGPGVLDRVNASEGKAVLVNVWATWCAPCVNKFPTVMKLREKYADSGLDVLFVSADFEETTKTAREFLRDQGVDFPTYLKTGKDHEFIEAFESDWAGALPVMFLYDADGDLVRTWGESVEHDEVEEAIESLLSAHS